MQKNKQTGPTIKVTTENAPFFKVGFALSITAIFLMMSEAQAGIRATFDIGLPEALNNIVLILGFILGSAFAYGKGSKWVNKEALKHKSIDAN